MPMNRNLYAVSAGNECRYPDKISVSAEFIIRNCRPRIGLGVFYMKNPDFSSRNWLGPPQPYFVDVAWFCRDRMQTVISPFVFSPFNSRPDVKAELQGIIFPDMIFYHCNIPYLLIEENNNQIIKRLYINYSERIMTNMALSMGLQPTETFPPDCLTLAATASLLCMLGLYGLETERSSIRFFPKTDIFCKNMIFPRWIMKLLNTVFFIRKNTGNLFTTDMKDIFLPQLPNFQSLEKSENI